jgi:DNA-binding NarL/FixJ family response regulator
MREARTELAAAQEAFGLLGAEGFAYRAARELRAAGGAARRADQAALTLLTPQELQIAQLAAEGLSNRQIGEQLFLAPDRGLTLVPPVPEAQHHHASRAGGRAGALT